MKKTSAIQLVGDYKRIEKSLLFIEKNFQNQPSLEQIAKEVGLSIFHFQKLFKRWAGVSPKRYLQFITVEHAKQLLDESKSVLEASFLTGLSGPGRLHDLFVTSEAVTPGQYKKLGAGLDIAYGIHPTPFGSALIAETEKGICHFQFINDSSPKEAIISLESHWPAARVREKSNRTSELVKKIFFVDNKKSNSLKLHLSGSNFQIKVWKALLSIPPGVVTSYKNLSTLMGQQGASRAVGSALARNSIAYLVPCHRVIKSLGQHGQYRWGHIRKQALLAWEYAQYMNDR